MRWVVLFIAFVALVGGFMLADQFPDLLDDYPSLRNVNSQAREWLGLEQQDPTFLSDDSLEAPTRILQEEAEAARRAAACGEPPRNPWAFDQAPTRQDIDNYYRQKEAWGECVRQLRVHGSDGAASPARRRSAKLKLSDFKEEQ